MADLSGLTRFVSAWAAVTGRACLQGGLALIVAWLICRLPRLSPRIQCWIWRLAYVKLISALLWTAPVNVPILPAPASASALQFSGDWPTEPILSAPVTVTAKSSAAPEAGALLLSALFALWLAGASWRLGTAGRDWLRLKRLRARCSALDDAQLAADCRELCARLGLRRNPALLLLDGDGAPFLTGVLSAAIILPEPFWADCTAEQRRLILAHELAHIRRGDLLWAWIPLLGRCLFFFLPPVWFAEREWQQSQEMACDEQVLWLAAVPPTEYGDLLLKVAQQPHPAFPSGLVAVHVAGSYATVRRRLLAMKHSGKTPRRTLVATGAMVALVGAAVIVPWRVSAQDAEKSSKESRVKPGGDVLLEKQLIRELNLDDAQIRQTLVIGKEGARQILQLLTPEQRQRAVVGGGGGWPEILESLNLNDAQKVRIKALMDNQERQKQALKEQQKQALKAGTSQTPQNLEEEVKSIDEETMARINETLTPQQERQLADALSQRKVEEDQVPLTDAQIAKLGALKRGFGQQMEAINADNTLTKEQKEGRVVDMKRSLERQWAQIVTPEQQKQMAEREQQSRTMRANGPFHLVNLERVENLTPDQRTRIQAIYAGVDRQFIQLLTATQQQRLQQVLTGEPKVEGKRPENAAGGPR